MEQPACRRVLNVNGCSHSGNGGREFGLGVGVRVVVHGVGVGTGRQLAAAARPTKRATEEMECILNAVVYMGLKDELNCDAWSRGCVKAVDAVKTRSAEGDGRSIYIPTDHPM